MDEYLWTVAEELKELCEKQYLVATKIAIEQTANRTRTAHARLRHGFSRLVSRIIADCELSPVLSISIPNPSCKHTTVTKAPLSSRRTRYQLVVSATPRHAREIRNVAFQAQISLFFIKVTA